MGKMIVRLIFVVALFSSIEAFAAQAYDMVRIEQGKYSMDVIHQSFNGKEWSKELNLTNNKADDFTPVIVGFPGATSAGSLMLVWVESTGLDLSELRFRVRGKSDWSEAVKIDTLTTHNSLPTLLADSQGRVWCFWVGFDGQDDEIYFSVYETDKWRIAQKLYAQDNVTPDIMPVARLDEKQRPVVTWQRLDSEEFVYKFMQSVLLPIADDKIAANAVKHSWSKVKSVIPNPFKTITTPTDFQVPKQVSRADSVSLYFPSIKGYTLQLGRLR